MYYGTLALLTRTLRLDARRLRAHLIRVGFAGLICLCLVWAHATSVLFGAPGLMFFTQICYLNYGLITLAGISYFSTAITEEKEEETLGLLRLAGMGALGLLLGKSTCRMISASILLLVQFPFILVAITLGGVTLLQIVAAYVALLAYLVLLANLGLFSSVICRTSSRATAMTAVIVAVMTIGPPLVQLAGSATWLRQRGLISRDVEESLALGVQSIVEMSPIDRLRQIRTTGFSEAIVSSQVVAHLAGSLVLFLLAWGLFQRYADPRATTPDHRSSRTSRATRWFRPGRAWANACLWKDFYFVAGGTKLLVGKAVIYGLIAAAIAYTAPRYVPGRWLWEFGDTLMGTMLAALAIESCVSVSRVFRDEIHDRTLPLLILTPRATGETAFSKVAGCALGLVPAASYFVLGAVASPVHLLEFAEHPGVWTAIVLFAILLHLTAYFSLSVGWGALALALGVLFLGLQCCPIMLVLVMISSSMEHTIMMALPSLVIGAVIVVPLQVLIAQRLRDVAAR